MMIILSIFANEVYSQDLSALSKSDRDKEIRKICKESILKYGDSRYWIEDAKEEIEFIHSYKKEPNEQQLNNKPIYIVTYKTKKDLDLIKSILNGSDTAENKKQSIANIFSTQVLIFADTGKVARVVYGRANLGYSLYKMKTRSSNEIKKIDY